MITRVSRLRVDPSRVGEAERVVAAELAPAVLEQPGAIGGRWMVEPDTGEVLTAVQWADEAAMFAGGAALADVRDRVVGALRATPISLQLHEVVGVAVEEPLSLGEVTWSDVVVLDGADDSTRPDAAAMFRIMADEHLGKPGYTGTVWSADFGSGTLLCLTTWRSLDALVHAGDESALVWPQVARALSMRIETAGHRRTLGQTPAEHVIDLTPFDRVAGHLRG